MVKAPMWVTGIVLVGCVIAIYLSLTDWYYWQDHLAERPRPTISQLTRQLKEIPFGDQAEIRKTFDKDVSVVVRSKFNTAKSVYQVVETFKELMPRSGWRLDNEKSHGDILLKYCRDGIAAVIEPSALGEGTTAYISVSWTYHRSASNYCANDADPAAAWLRSATP